MLELGDGVIGILGQNGVGKSSLIEAIAWAIYGNESTIVRDGKAGVRWSQAGPNDECRVTIEFDLETDHYRLERWLKGAAAKSDAVLYVNDRIEANGDKAVTDTMGSRLGMDHKAFFISIFARQKDLNALSVLRPSERKKLVLRMLGIDVLDTVVDEISKDIRELRDKTEMKGRELLGENGQDRMTQMQGEVLAWKDHSKKLLSDIDALRKKAAELDSSIEIARKDMERTEGRSRTYHSYKTKVAELETGLRERQAHLEKVQRDIEALEKRKLDLPGLESAEKDHRAVETRRELLEMMRSKHVHLESLKQLMVQRSEETSKLDEEIAQVEDEIAGLGNPDEKLSVAEDALTRYDEVISQLREDSSWCTRDIDRFRGELKEKVERLSEIRKLGPDSICPSCERPLEHQHEKLVQKTEVEMSRIAAVIAELEGRKGKAEEAVRKNIDRRGTIDAKRKDALKVKETLAGLRTKLTSSRSALARAKDDMARAGRQIDALGVVEFDPEEMDRVKKELSVQRSRLDLLVRLRSELQRLDPLQKERADLGGSIESMRKDLEGQRSLLKDLDFKPEELSASRATYAEMRDRRDMAERHASTLRTELAVKEGAIATAEARIKELNALREEVEASRRTLAESNVLLTVMKDFRSNVMSRIVPTLSATASELFIELTDGKYGGLELDEDYEIHVYDQGQRYPVSRFSGGESDLANLCLRLAISRLIADRSGRHINFLVLDEIFGSQDSVRKRNILQMMSALERQFGQIMIITHIEDVKDAVGDLVMVKELADGSSIITRDGSDV